MASPVKLVHSLLITANVGIDGVSATNAQWGIFTLKEPPSRGRTITAYLAGGPAANPRWAIDYPSVQIRTKSADSNAEEALNKIIEVKNALLGIAPLDLLGDRIVAINALSDAIDLGFDDANRARFVQNFSMIVEPGSTGFRDPL